MAAAALKPAHVPLQPAYIETQSSNAHTAVQYHLLQCKPAPPQGQCVHSRRCTSAVDLKVLPPCMALEAEALVVVRGGFKVAVCESNSEED